jgi:hypothetical protein
MKFADVGFPQTAMMKDRQQPLSLGKRNENAKKKLNYVVHLIMGNVLPIHLAAGPVESSLEALSMSPRRRLLILAPQVVRSP